MSVNLNKCVAYYLMSAYLYSNEHEVVLDDPTYDRLCTVLHKNFEEIDHPHREYLDKEALETGTTMHFRWSIMPKIIQSAAHQWSRERNAAKKAQLVLEVLDD